MGRPLVSLGIGLLAVVLVALAAVPDWASIDNLLLVGLTAVAGIVVMAVVGRRAAMRRRAEELAQLEDEHLATRSDDRGAA